MTSAVYACNMRTSYTVSLLTKIGWLLDRLGIGQRIKTGDLTAVKVHFGERGNTAYIRPVFLRPIIEAVKAAGGAPFLTDANTLYVGARSNAVAHMNTAIENGFAYAVVGAPILIADGLKGTSSKSVPIHMEQVDTAYVGSDIAEADVLISVAHFKLHELAGFGGAIKNVGMGSAARRGKLVQHSGIGPKVKGKQCIGCGDCVVHCAQKAIELKGGDGKSKPKAWINPEICVGCGECILVCRQQAIQIQWNESLPNFMKKMVEYTAAALKGKDGKAFYLNFLIQISPGCDCLPHADAPIVRDIGILASTDPVAIDQASIDLVNQEGAAPGCSLKSHTAPGDDKVRGVYPEIDWSVQLEYAEKVGLGSRQYELVWVDAEHDEKLKQDQRPFPY